MADTTESFTFQWAGFIGGFAIGILYVYMMAPPKKLIVIAPNPFNAGKVTYRDTSDSCFQFKANEVKCPSNKKEIHEHAILLPQE